MKILSAIVVAVALGIATNPALAQTTPNGGTGAVSGLGPGGSGAGQSSAGPSKAFLKKGKPMRRKHQHS